jgi:hypothetical protein
MAVMPRFVLLYHDCPSTYPRQSHWDLMLETGDVLRTWALKKLPRDWEAAHEHTRSKYPQCPLLAADNAVAAEQLGEHRRDYLEFEGPVSGNRGAVIRIAAGSFDVQWETPLGWCLSLSSPTISGGVVLDAADDKQTSWTLSLLPSD